MARNPALGTPRRAPSVSARVPRWQSWVATAARWVGYCAPVCLAATAQCGPDQSVTATSALAQVGAQLAALGEGRHVAHSHSSAGVLSRPTQVGWAVRRQCGPSVGVAGGCGAVGLVDGTADGECRRMAAVWVYTSCLPELHRRCRCGHSGRLAGRRRWARSLPQQRLVGEQRLGVGLALAKPRTHSIVPEHGGCGGCGPTGVPGWRSAGRGGEEGGGTRGRGGANLASRRSAGAGGSLARISRSASQTTARNVKAARQVASAEPTGLRLTRAARRRRAPRWWKLFFVLEAEEGGTGGAAVGGWSRHRRRHGSGLATGTYWRPVVVSCARRSTRSGGRAAELPRAHGEGGEGGPPCLARPVAHEGQHAGAGVGDTP